MQKVRKSWLVSQQGDGETAAMDFGAKHWGAPLVSKPARSAILTAVESNIAHVKLVIELESDPIKGSVSSEVVPARSFNGWIELVEAIEDARRGTSGSSNGSDGGGKD